MNKSKFLKKSLAMVLAVMLVVAMIPLGASAAPGSTTVNDGVVLTITTAAGTLEKTGEKSYTDTLPYNQSGPETLTVELAEGTVYDGGIKSVVTKADDTTVEGTALAIEVANGAKKVTFKAVSSDGKKESAEYTVTMNQPAPSGSVAIKEAKMDGEIKGVINNKTITFTIPWGYAGAKAVTATLEYPNLDTPLSPVTGVVGTDVPMPVTAQNGATDTYTIVTKEMEPVSQISVGGVAAVLDEETGKYVVTLPEGTKPDEAVAISYRLVNNGDVKIAKAEWAGKEFTNGAKKAKDGTDITVADNQDYTLTFTSNKTTTKAYTVHVDITKSKDATIKSFTATGTTKDAEGNATGTFTETGTVNGKKLTVVLPYSTDLEHVKLEFTPTTTGAAIAKVAGAAFTANTTEVDLKDKEVLVDVVAVDGTTHMYYELSATTAPNPYGNPTISGAVLTIGKGTDDEKEYTGVISGTTITFTVPYATTAAAVNTWTNYTFAKSFATNYDSEDNFDTEDPFKDNNTLSLTSQTGDKVTYTLVYKKEAAKTGKTVSGFSFSRAQQSDKVTADNTYNVTVSGTKASITLPFSDKGPGEDNGTTNETVMVPTFTLPEGAALYIAKAGTLDATVIASGYNAEDADTDPKEAKCKTIKIQDLAATATENGEKKFTTKIVVADEAAKVELVGKSTVPMTDLDADPYKGHVTVYDVEVKFAAAETGHTLTALSADKGLVTAKVSGTSVEITVPDSYKDGSKTFYADYTASKLATVTYGGVTLPSEIPDAAGATGELKVVADGEGYKLQVFDGTWKDASAPAQIIVGNEAKTATTPYTVTVKVAPAETGADVTSLKVNNTVGVINKTAKTVTVTLPYGTDLTAVTMEYEVSKLAPTPVLSIAGTPDPDDADTTLYNVSEPFTITVTAEDGKTTKVYTVTVTANEQFSDVKATDYFYADVYAAASAGIVKGNDKGQFLPRTNVTRRDFALMVVRMLGVEEEAAKYTTTTFTDVAKNDYALGAIAYCAENGIINGDGKGHFMPGSAITREAAAQMTAKALKLTLGTTSTEFKDDASISSWAKAAVAACAKEGIIKGSNGNYMPKANIQRCDAAAILVRALNK